MVLAFFLLHLFGFVSSLSCVGHDGNPVDWFFAYKLPGGTDIGYYFEEKPPVSGTPGARTGWTVQQVQAAKAAAPPQVYYTWANSAIHRTLQQLNRASGISDDNVFLYNDQSSSCNGFANGAHAKGLVAWDATDAFWLIHSVPRGPYRNQGGDFVFEDNIDVNGQSFLCVSTTTVQAFDIVKMLRTIETIAYDLNGRRFATLNKPNWPDATKPLKKVRKCNYFFLNVGSRVNKHFRAVYRTQCDKDGFYKHLREGLNPTTATPIGTTVGIGVYSESPTNINSFTHALGVTADFDPAVQPTLHSAGFVLGSDWSVICHHEKKNANNVHRLKHLGGSFIDSEHAKIAISNGPIQTAFDVNPKNVVCVGDLNLGQSRGGGSLCFVDNSLRNLLLSSLVVPQDAQIQTALSQNKAPMITSAIGIANRISTLIATQRALYTGFVPPPPPTTKFDTAQANIDSKVDNVGGVLSLNAAALTTVDTIKATLKVFEGALQLAYEPFFDESVRNTPTFLELQSHTSINTSLLQISTTLKRENGPQTIKEWVDEIAELSLSNFRGLLTPSSGQIPLSSIVSALSSGFYFELPPRDTTTGDDTLAVAARDVIMSRLENIEREDDKFKLPVIKKIATQLGSLAEQEEFLFSIGTNHEQEKKPRKSEMQRKSVKYIDTDKMIEEGRQRRMEQQQQLRKDKREALLNERRRRFAG